MATAHELTPLLLPPVATDRTLEQLLANGPAVVDYVVARLLVTDGGAPCAVVARALDRLDDLEVSYRRLFDVDPTHAAFATVERPAEQGAARVEPMVFTQHRRRWSLRAALPWWRTPVDYLRLGVAHILGGCDHLAFVLALLLGLMASGRIGGTAASAGRRLLRRLALLTSGFTLAHSLTLALAALDLLRPPEAWIEVAIAASVAFVALDNVLAPDRWRWRSVEPVVFGLLHGLGFAAVLREVGLPAGSRLAAFNVGVEAGQLAVVLVAAPLALGAMRAGSSAGYGRGVRAASGILFVVACGWMALRLRAAVAERSIAPSSATSASSQPVAVGRAPWVVLQPPTAEPLPAPVVPVASVDCSAAAASKVLVARRE